MKFTSTLIKGKLIKRYKRFFADIKVNNSTVTAHCPNTGSMLGLLDKNNEAWISKADDPNRKLKFTLEIINSKKLLILCYWLSPIAIYTSFIHGQLDICLLYTSDAADDL